MATLNLSASCSSSSSFRVSFSSHPPNAHGVLSNSFSAPTFFLPSINLKLKSGSRSRIASSSRIVASAPNSLSDTQKLPLPETPQEFAAQFPAGAGVYAVFDSNDELQFIGISRNIAASLFNHLKSVPELCRSVKIRVVSEADRTALTQAWKSWMEEHIKATGKVPPGNESGNNTWVTQPARKKQDLRLTPGRHVQLTVPLEELIDKLVKENKVVAFIKGSRSAPLCGFSQRVVGILESERVDYESVDVLDEEYNCGLRETLKKYSNWPTFPQVFVNGELVGGCDILSSMHEKGELAAVFKK